MIIDKIYMINLERKKDVADNSINRLNNLTKNNNLFSNINIFKAVDGQLLNKNEINNYLTLKAKYTFINPSSYDDIRSIGEIGCYLSHTKIWKEIIDNNYKNCIIFEDDVIPNNNYETIINYLDNIPNDYDIAYLGWWSRLSFDSINHNSYWSSTDYDNNNKQNILGLYSYVLSNNGAQKLLSKAFPIDVQLDTFVSLYNNVNKDFKRYLSKEKLFEADKTILGDQQTHTVCNKCKFFYNMYKNNLFY